VHLAHPAGVPAMLLASICDSRDYCNFGGGVNNFDNYEIMRRNEYNKKPKSYTCFIP